MHHAPDVFRRCDPERYLVKASQSAGRSYNLLLPGSLFMAIGPQLFAPLMFVDFRFPAFFQ